MQSVERKRIWNLEFERWKQRGRWLFFSLSIFSLNSFAFLWLGSRIVGIVFGSPFGVGDHGVEYLSRMWIGNQKYFFCHFEIVRNILDIERWKIRSVKSWSGNEYNFALIVAPLQCLDNRCLDVFDMSNNDNVWLFFFLIFFNVRICQLLSCSFSFLVFDKANVGASIRRRDEFYFFDVRNIHENTICFSCIMSICDWKNVLGFYSTTQVYLSLQLTFVIALHLYVHCGDCAFRKLVMIFCTVVWYFLLMAIWHASGHCP